MPKFLEKKLKAEYPNNPSAVYGTMNKLGAMHGSRETAKGAAMERKHEHDVAAPKKAVVKGGAPPPAPARQMHGDGKSHWSKH